MNESGFIPDFFIGLKNTSNRLPFTAITLQPQILR